MEGILGKLIKSRGDMVIICTTVSLIMIGILFIYSSSGPFCKFMNPPRPTWYFLLKQTFWAMIAFLFMFLMYRLDYEFMIKISPGLIIASIFALILVLFLSHSEIKRWISIGGISVQPSEFFKIGLVAFIARIAGKSQKIKSGKRFMPAIAMGLFGSLLVLLEPDLGTTTLLLAAIAILLYLSGFKKRHLLLLPFIGAVTVAIMVFAVGYEKDRVDSYLTTLNDPFREDANYQTRQSLVSFGSG
jgi:cell division protein FtsW